MSAFMVATTKKSREPPPPHVSTTPLTNTPIDWSIFLCVILTEVLRSARNPCSPPKIKSSIRMEGLIFRGLQVLVANTQLSGDRFVLCARLCKMDVSCAAPSQLRLDLGMVSEIFFERIGDDLVL